MRQSKLNIVPRLPYVAEDFLLHAGIAADYERCIDLITSARSALIYFLAAPGSGKTHMAVRLEHDLLCRGVATRQLSAGELSELTLGAAELPEQCLIVDDAHYYLETVAPGESGPFVNFAERVKHARKTVVLLSACPIEQFAFDAHLASRVRAGSGFSIDLPHSSDLPQLLKLLSRQRGLALSERKTAALLRDSARSIPGLIRQLERTPK